ncbi:MAG TPA: hypothetical protein VLF90_00845 [Patescibacteria group bacterium]|nr:hypothetical protein [Patescibacteria group bacterium]
MRNFYCHVDKTGIEVAESDMTVHDDTARVVALSYSFLCPKGSHTLNEVNTSAVCEYLVGRGARRREYDSTIPIDEVAERILISEAEGLINLFEIEDLEQTSTDAVDSAVLHLQR